MKFRVPSNFNLRGVTSEDHEFLVELHNDPVVLKNLTHSTPIKMGQHLAWWETVRTNPKQARLIFTVDEERAGFAKFYDIDTGNRCCVLGGDIHESFRGRGYAKYMWSLMLSRCFDDWNLNRVSLTTAAYNEVARYVYTRLGFKEEGKLEQSLWRNGSFHDQVAMRLLKSEWEAMEIP